MALIFSADTETHLLKPGLQAPPLVCLQWCYAGAPEIVHVRDPACRRTVLEALTSDAIWNFHNLAYDICVLMAKWPDLVSPLLDLYDADRATCTILRQKLLDIARGTFKVHSKRGYDLGTVARRHKLSDLVNKDDPWRLRYAELTDVPISLWPADAVAYALNDAVAQRAVYRAQDAYARERGFPLVDQYRQARAGLWLRLMECTGIMVDPARVDQYIADVKETLAEDRAVCADAGLVRRDGTKDTKAAMRWMASLCNEETGIPLTEKGEELCRDYLDLSSDADIPPEGAWRWYCTLAEPVGVALNEDAVIQYGDDRLEAYQRYSTSTTQLSRAERFALAARARVPIQASFGVLQDTGRTSCSQGDRKSKTGTPSAYGAQLQNPARDKKVKRRDGTVFLRKGPRELLVARPGFVFCSTDYGGMELSGWAQNCIWFTKSRASRLAEVLRAGQDPHTEIGATLLGCSVDEAYARRKGLHGPAAQKDFDDGPRDRGKKGNFSFQGGAGGKRFALMVRKQSGVPLDPDPARALEIALEIRDAWFTTWPEAREYFQWVTENLSGPYEDRRGSFVHPGSGRMRAGMWFSAYANNAFQGLCADIFKAAGWRVSYEMYTGRYYDGRPGVSPLYGGRLVNELHDELFSELREETAHEGAFRQAEIQVETASEWGPDVPWFCEPALMRRWYKQAAKVLRDGRLIPWEPGMRLAPDGTLLG